jgi:hypothetical protein
MSKNDITGDNIITKWGNQVYRENYDAIFGNKRRKFHVDGSGPEPDQFFVFGSNKRGVHGAGAARYAMDHLGAKLGEWDGITGKTYAIPTKDEYIQTMEIEEIFKYVAKFVKFTKDNFDLNFFITGIGCGLAGYTPEEIAPLFRDCGANCSFPDTWEPYL